MNKTAENKKEMPVHANHVRVRVRGSYDLGYGVMTQSFLHVLPGKAERVREHRRVMGHEESKWATM